MRATVQIGFEPGEGETMSFDSILLAAGKGTRMKSQTSKVLHPLAGRKLLFFAVRAALEAGSHRVVVVCREEDCPAVDEYLVSAFGRERITCVVQAQARGTGDAAKVGLAACDSDNVCILCGDTPLLQGTDLRPLVELKEQSSANLVVASALLDNPSGYGRILRDGNDRVTAIVEHRDATEAQRQVNEVNAGLYFGSASAIRDALAKVLPNNDQGEYYLTDIVHVISSTAKVVARIGSRETLLGVNDRIQLEEAESILLARIRNRHRLAGVTVRGNARIDDAVEIGQDSVIADGVELRGTTKVGERTLIDKGSVLTNMTVGNDTVVLPYSIMTDSSVGNTAQIGPFSHLRPASTIEDSAHIGNFVETKKTRVRRGAKANHLAYLGDGDVGEKANIGAGTIFCNYDGYKKHLTTIGPGAFIGSDSQIVAPVVIGKGAYVATGTTVTRDVPDDALAISRTKQENKDGYASRLRNKLALQAGKKP
jgi:bifunctional UDP-N-acetylglucosamine pyrophosphorylase/glucosamine-1-phosphate N-acetyltransferase